MVYGTMLAGVVFCLCYLAIVLTDSGTWDLDATKQDTSLDESVLRSLIVERTSYRALAASLFATVSFSLFVNGLIDKIGLIDPSTSTGAPSLEAPSPL